MEEWYGKGATWLRHSALRDGGTVPSVAPQSSTTMDHIVNRFMMRAHLHIISTFMYATLYARMYTPIPLNTFCAMCAVGDDIWVCLKHGVHGAHPRN